MQHNPLADAISAIKNAEMAGKKECTVRKISRTLTDTLKVMQAAGYIEKFETVDTARGGTIKITTSGRINNCGIILPRFFVKKDGYERWEKQYFPAAGVGVLIVSTSSGIVSHRDVRGKIGGSLVAFVY